MSGTKSDARRDQCATSSRDPVVKGLELRTFASGHQAYYLYYRTKAGVQRRPKLGDTKTLTLAAARRAARTILEEVAAGKDPGGAWKAAKEAPTVATLAERYWERHASQQKANKDVRRHLDQYILPMLRARKAADITYADAEHLHSVVAEHAPIQANRVLATFSKMLSLAERWEMRPIGSNPCRLVQRAKERSRRRYLTAGEAPRLAAALKSHETNARAGVAFISLLLYTGARCGEIARAKWDQLDGNVLRLPDSKNGRPRDVHLPPAAMEVLDKLPRTNGRILGIVSPAKLWQTVRKEAGCPDLRLHDLRHSFASAAISAGLTLSAIGELLGHRNTQTTARYSHLMTEAATAAATVAAERIEQLMKGQKENSKP